jgi:hypothetical protein
LVVDELVDLTREGRTRIIGLIRQELLSGFQSLREGAAHQAACAPRGEGEVIVD